MRGQASPALSVEQLEEGLGRLLGECEVLRASKLVGRVGGEEGLTMEEMVEASGLSKEVFEEVYLSWVDGTYHPFVSLRSSSLTPYIRNQSKRRISNCTNAQSTSSPKLSAFSSSANSVYLCLVLPRKEISRRVR